MLPCLIGQAIAPRVDQNGCTRVQAWTVLARVAEALPGRGRKQLKISVIKVTVRTVPRSNDEIPARTTRPQSLAGMLPCPPGSHDEPAALGRTAMEFARSGMEVASALAISRRLDYVAGLQRLGP